MDDFDTSKMTVKCTENDSARWPHMTAPIPKVNATLSPAWAKGYWNVQCWNHDDPTDRKAYTIRAASDNEAAQEGIRRFLADHAPDEGSACLGPQPA
jgi:hypothetical protein